ncbi:TRPM1 [Mytilus coruscus]|uniref:TRPM1 n=1 Tax=Mytilus coruscus TaxID=42192 RepID=A0A6J8B7Z8_MYTCO|nr:TRPM1 [Mytilus coruscus]
MLTAPDRIAYKEIHDTVDQTDWGTVLKKEWHVSPPEAIIAITGISHQFNIKNKRNLKKDLIEAVISTGSWIVTCGTESGVVQFIEDAVDDHVAVTTYNIPIVGILSKRVLDEIQPLKRVLKVKTNVDGRRITIHTNSTKETLDPNHTQFIVLGDPGITLPGSCASNECRNAFQSFLSKVKDAVFKTDEYNDKPEIKNHDKSKKAKCETNEKLPVVLVLIEGGIEAIETALSVLKNNNHVVVIDGSGGAANFLSTCYQRDTSYNHEPATLSDSVEAFKELIYECFEDDSEDLINKAKYLEMQCVKKHKLIQIYSLHENTTKVADLIQNAIFNKHKEYYKPKDAEVGNQSGSKDKNLLKINAVKKQLKLVEKWKRCDIAEKEIFIARNRKQLKDLQTLDEQKMTKLPKKIKQVVDQVKDRYKCLSEDFSNSYQQFMEIVAQFKKKGNKGKYYLALMTSFNELVEQVDHMPLVKHVKYKHQLMEIRKEFAGLQTLRNKKMNELERLDELQRINKLTDDINLIMIKFMDKYDKIIIKLADSYAKFEKSVFQFEKVNKKPYFWALSQSFYQLLNHMPVDNSETIRKKFEKIETEFDNLQKRKNRKNNKILSAVNNFIIDLFEDTEFKLYDLKGGEIDVIYRDKPFHHLFVWAVLVNWREMAMIFWELETDHTCSALFASAVLNELADKALFSKHMHLSVSLKENARHFETLACNVMTELYSTNRESALKTLVTKVGRYNSTPLKIAVSQKLNKFMAHTACQAQLNSIWSGDVAVYTPLWRIGMVTFFPILLIQRIGFITMKRKYLTSKQISPRADQNPKDNSDNKTGLFLRIFNILYSVYRFYCAPVTKFFVYMILQTNKGSLLKNLKYWAKDVWNIFDIVMYLMFLLSVVLRCLLISDQFYFARAAYAVTLSMFILRSMHFFFIERFIGPKVVMIGRMFGDLGFFIALMHLSSPWELLKDLVYLPYWQLYGELNIDRIEGKEPSECTNNPQLYTNGTMERCAVTNQYNALMLAVYLVLTNILLVNILIAMFSQTFQTVQDNSEIIWKFHKYALVSEYYERPMFPIPIVIHLWRIVVFCYDKLRTTKKFGGAFVYDVKPEEIERLHIVEKIAYETFQNGPSFARNRYDARNMMTDERDINKEIDSTPTQHDIKDLREEMHRMSESLIQEIRRLDYRQPVLVLDYPRR